MKHIVTQGQKFGKLTIVNESEKIKQPSGQKVRAFLCECECGKNTIVRLAHLVRGRIISCGCIQGEKHGDSKNPLYRVWHGMIERCYNRNSVGWEYYGAKGIIVCAEWKNSYISFREWALKNNWQKGLHIDRINNTRNYEPNNCRIVTPLKNANNKDQNIKVEVDGLIISFRDALRKYNLEDHAAAIWGRMHRGWTFEESVKTPIGKNKYPIRKGKHSVGERINIAKRYFNNEPANDLAKEYGINVRTVYKTAKQYREGYFDAA